MNERFKLVLVKLVCADIDVPTGYDFEKNYLAIKDTEDESQPYGIIYDRCADIGKILMEIKKSNELGRPTKGLCFCGEYSNVAWEFEYDYKFEEIYNQK